MSKIFLSAKPSLGLNDLVSAEIWESVFQCAPPADFGKFDRIAPADFPLAAAAAMRWIPGLDVEARFVLTKEAKAAIREVPQLCLGLLRYDSLSLGEKKGLLAATFFAQAAVILKAEGASMDPPELDQASWQTAGTLDPAPLLKGADILALGVPAGPRVKELLSSLRTAQLNEEIVDRDSALKWLQKQL